jgi:transcriptional regulator GlxA family with amidase domain
MENLECTRPALEWLRQQHAQGSIVVGLVTGVFYLAEAGLLSNREATIHWASENIFRQRYPTVRVNSKIQMVEADRIITTSTTPATFDATLLLIQHFLGDRSAELASHYFTIRDKDSPLPGFLEPSCNDTLIDAARDEIRLGFTEKLSLESLAKQLNVTPRTLSRRFLSATGMTPIRYLTRHRLLIARRLLQSTDLQIQQIAEQTGFASSTVFGRTFSKVYSQTPSEYRNSLRNSK